MAKSNVTKLDDGGYDVEFEGGGRVILSAEDASNQTDARKVAKERLESAGRVVDTDSADTPAEQPTVVDKDAERESAVNVRNESRTEDEA